MARRIIGYKDGKPVWSDNEPAPGRITNKGPQYIGYERTAAGSPGDKRGIGK